MVHAPAAPPRQARRGVRLVLVAVACLLAGPVPSELSEYPTAPPPVASAEKR